MAASDTVSIREPLDPELIKQTLSSPPFYEIEGLFNARTLPLPNPASAQSKRGLILRSGEPNGMTDDGKQRLLDLGIKRVFDLRSLKEVQRLSKGDIFIIPGVEIVSVPALVIAKGDQMGNTFQRFECGTDQPFMESYSDILNEGTASFRTIFEFLRDHLSSGDGCLIHCTAGKDRTGVTSMLILDLIGVSDEEIAKDYALTRIGLETSRDTLIARFQHLLDNPDSRPGAENAFSSRVSVMQAFLKVLRQSYGGAEGYLKDRLGFPDEDIRKIRESLLGTGTPSLL